MILPTAINVTIPPHVLIAEISPSQMDNASPAKLIIAEPAHPMMSALNASPDTVESVELLD